MTMPMISSTALKRLRLERRWTQAELAHRSQLSQTTIARLETGKEGWYSPSEMTIGKLADAFGDSYDSLLSRLGKRVA